MNQQNNECLYKFKPRITFKNTLSYYLLFIFILIAGAGLSILNLITGMLLMFFSSIVITMMLIQTLSFGSCYTIDRTGITAQRLNASKHFTFTEIDNIQIINESSIRQELKNTDDKTETENRLRNTFRNQMELADLIRFCTVNIVITNSSFSEHCTEKGKKVQRGKYILLTTSSGIKYLFSPRNSTGFKNTYETLAG